MVLKEVQSPEDLGYFHPVLQKFKNNDIKVFTIDIPRPVQTQRVYDTGSFRLNRAKLIDFYRDSFDVQHLGYDRDLDYNYFMDQGHLNTQGQEIYSLWLYDMLVGLYAN